MSWVLARAYHDSPEDVAAAIEALLRSEEITIDNTEASCRVGRAVDFADALIAQTARLAGAREILTFDRRPAGQSARRLLDATLVG